MIINDTLAIDGALDMVGGASHWFKITPKTTADRVILISGWGMAQRGRTWFNTDTLQWEGWDGTQIVLIG